MQLLKKLNIRDIHIHAMLLGWKLNTVRLTGSSSMLSKACFPTTTLQVPQKERTEELLWILSWDRAIHKKVVRLGCAHVKTAEDKIIMMKIKLFLTRTYASEEHRWLGTLLSCIHSEAQLSQCRGSVTLSPALPCWTRKLGIFHSLLHASVSQAEKLDKQSNFQILSDSLGNKRCVRCKTCIVFSCIWIWCRAFYGSQQDSLNSWRVLPVAYGVQQGLGRDKV